MHDLGVLRRCVTIAAALAVLAGVGACGDGGPDARGADRAGSGATAGGAAAGDAADDSATAGGGTTASDDATAGGGTTAGDDATADGDEATADGDEATAGGDGATAGGGVAGDPTAASPPALCGARRGRVVGRVQDPSLDELSGLVRSGGVLWAIEDSGAAPAVIALRPSGAVLGATTVTGAEAVDWEDIAAAGDSLFVADVGDNAAARPSVQIYRVARPAPGAAATDAADRLDLTYPDGPHDAEALIADPVRGELIVLTKAPTGARTYTVALDAPAGTHVPRAGPRVSEALVTAASLSGDGRVVATRNYLSVAVWRRQGRESLLRTLRRSPCRPDVDLLAEGQGEALALDRTGRTALTVPEAAGAPIRRYVSRP